LTTDFVKIAKIAGFYKELDNLLKISGDLSANISIINLIRDREQIDNLSGIAAILRYNLSD
jgi:stalled ribosome rescue protein Dom34